MSLILSLIIFATLVFQTSSFDFIDCGSTNIDIQDVYIEDCDSDPCTLIRGQQYKVIVVPEEVADWDYFTKPTTNDLKVDVFAVIRGALFEVEAQLAYDDIDNDISIDIELRSNYMRGFAPLIVNATWSDIEGQFCVLFDVFVA